MKVINNAPPKKLGTVLEPSTLNGAYEVIHDGGEYGVVSVVVFETYAILFTENDLWTIRFLDDLEYTYVLGRKLDCSITFMEK